MKHITWKGVYLVIVYTKIHRVRGRLKDVKKDKRAMEKHAKLEVALMEWE